MQGEALKAAPFHSLRALAARTLVTAADLHLHLVVLALVPVILLILDRNWIFSGPHRDAWIYYGYYENGAYYLATFPDRYYSSRAAAFLPGFAIHHLLPPVAANVVLHLGLTWASLLSFYGVVRDLFDRHVALLSGLAFGCHPLLLHALGWNYVDGFGITYFLVSLLLSTLATRSRRLWWLWAAAAGASVMALGCTNLFYWIYGPVVAGHFLLLNRHRQRHSPFLAALAAGIGGAVLLLAVGTVSWSVGGPFFFLAPSFGFLAERAQTTNPFRDATYRWLPDAVWLVVPVTAVLGTISALSRSRGDRRAEVPFCGPQVWSQLQLLYLAVALAFFQVWGDTAVLQHFYYASLLIPSAFLALAGQVRPLLPALDARRFAGLAAAVAVVQLAPAAVPKLWFLSPKAQVLDKPFLWAHVAAAGALLVVASGHRRRAAVVTFFAFLAGAHLVIWQTSGIFRSFEPYGGDGAGLFRQMSRSVIAIEEFDPSHRVRLWYDLGADHGRVYDAVASAFLLCPRMVNLGFPALRTRRLCDGRELTAGMTIVILSDDARAFEKAATTLDRLDFEARLMDREEVPGPIPDFALTFLRVDGQTVEEDPGDPPLP